MKVSKVFGNYFKSKTIANQDATKDKNNILGDCTVFWVYKWNVDLFLKWVKHSPVCSIFFINTLDSLVLVLLMMPIIIGKN